MFITILALYAICSVGGLTCFKIGAQQALNMNITNKGFSLNISWLSLLGLIMYVVSFLIYMGLVAKTQLSYLIPVSTSIVYILTMLVSFLVFHETFTTAKIIGIVLVLCGVFLMNIGK